MASSDEEVNGNFGKPRVNRASEKLPTCQPNVPQTFAQQAVAFAVIFQIQRQS
jgi:hypothetical protein